MGKSSASQQLPSVHGRSNGGHARRRSFFCERCSVVVRSIFSVKCCAFLILGFAVFLSAFFCVVRVGYREPGFDAKDSIKTIAIVQVSFKLQRPVSDMLPYISRLEYDVNGEIGVPSLKIAVLSMHPMHLSNRISLSNSTSVVFGFTPDPTSTMTSVALSILKSSVVDLFLQRYNLTLTTSIFGQPSLFEILKFPGGITIVPERDGLIVEPLFTFILNSSIDYITQNLPELKEQLKWGLQLMPNEVIYIQVTNQNGSTVNPPVSVEASIASDLGTPLPERLKQLAQIITKSPPKENLGLNHSVFGKVKQISLSSFLNHSLQAPSPSSSPSPSPAPSPSSSTTTFPSPAPSPDLGPPVFTPDPHNPLGPAPSNMPYHRSLAPKSNSPSPSCGSTHSPSPSPSDPHDQKSPNLSPHSSNESPTHSIAPSPDGKSWHGFRSPLHASSSSPSASLSSVSSTWRLCMFRSAELITVLLLLCIL